MALTPEQLANRKIGGSMVATILGVDPYKTAFELYGEMVEAVEREDISDLPQIRAGNVLEDGIAELTAERLSEQEGREIKLHRVNKSLSPVGAPWITGHIDRRIVGEKRGVEIKNVGWRMMKHWGAIDTDDLPTNYLAQVHTYLFASDYDEWTVAAYFGGPDLRMYRVLRDLDMDHLIREATGRFWHEHVLKRVPPPVDFAHSTTLRAIKRMYAGTNGEIVIATDEIKAWSKVREQAREAAKRYEAVAAGADAHLLEFMGEGAILDLGDGTRYTRKVVNRKGYTAVVEPTSYVDFRFGKTKE